MSYVSPSDHLVLHALRTLGYADTAQIAARTRLTVDEVEEHLLDAEAHGWVTWSTHAGSGSWSQTERGKAHGESLLAVELDAAGARAAVELIYADFLQLNDVVTQACTRWQLGEMRISAEPVSIDEVTHTLERAAEALEPLSAGLARELARFQGYHSRFAAALAQARADPGWITGIDRDSAHRVWFELHEDLIATLGLTR